jgi:hypothetical protein
MTQGQAGPGPGPEKGRLALKGQGQGQQKEVGPGLAQPMASVLSTLPLILQTVLGLTRNVSHMVEGVPTALLMVSGR